MSEPQVLLLADANVLIDFRDSDVDLLGLLPNAVGKLHVARPVLEQVKGLSARDCARLAITLVDADAGQLVEAASFAPDLGFEDSLCLILCRDRGWTCVTNDRRLGERCREYGISVRRGLRLLLDLRSANAAPAGRLARAAQAMHTANPFHIHREILERFLDELAKLAD
jgi:rRNA-processing protein FCF1